MHSKYEVSKIQISLDGKMCEVLWKDQHFSRFFTKWLRFNCQCHDCSLKISGNPVEIYKFPEDLTLEQAVLDKEETTLLTKYSWDVLPSHITKQPLQWLRLYCHCDKCLESVVESRDVISQHFSDTTTHKEIPTMVYLDIENKDIGLYRMLQNVMHHGFCLVKNIPTTDRMVVKFASEIGPLRHILHSDTKVFDVLPRNIEHVAHTKSELQLHMDQEQYEYSVGVVMLHAKRVDKEVNGGDTTLVDMFEAAEIFRKEFPEDFKTFLEVPVCFGAIDYERELPIYFEIQKYHIQVDYFKKIVGVNWHNGYVSTLRIKEHDMERYYKEHRIFSEITQRPNLTGRHNFRLETGDLLFLNNRRLAHGRAKFESNGGVRHLQVCFMNMDDVKSKYMVLSHKLGFDVVPPKTGNNSSI